MFELSVAFKYLIPRWRQLSVSIISLVSTLVIALVVWLIVVFFSVKDGLENSWIEKIVALTAPVRLTPTEKYYQSYYYLIDTISSQSNYTAKSLGEKLAATSIDPYQSDVDEEIPAQWPMPDRTPDGEIRDPVKEAFQIASKLPGLQNLQVADYETALANMRLRLLRHTNSVHQQFLEHVAYVGSYDANAATLSRAIYEPSSGDILNLLQMLSVSPDNIQEDSPNEVHQWDTARTRERLKQFFSEVQITALQTPAQGWRLPHALLPKDGHFKVVAAFRNGKIMRLVIPFASDQIPALMRRLQADYSDLSTGELVVDNQGLTLLLPEKKVAVSHRAPLFLDEQIVLPATLIDSSLNSAENGSKIKFEIHARVQGQSIQGKVSLGSLEISQAHLLDSSASSFFARTTPNEGLLLPKDPLLGEPILLPRGFKEGGIFIGDQGFLSYYSPTPSSVQEQRIPSFVAGFYDPGIMPLGSKFILANKELASLLRSAYTPEDTLISNGINIRFDNIREAPKVKAALLKAFEEAGIAPYWQVETYQEFEFSKDLIQQLHSEKNLFSLISLVIIVVACSNIISMLIILVNDKKLEIGILRSMGASSFSIAAIFGLCGMVMGALGSLIGIVAAVVTIRHVNELVGLMSRLQGYDLFNPVFYGHTLPSELSVEALTFVLVTTAFISLLAGVVPAVKACLLRPSAILRAE